MKNNKFRIIRADWSLQSSELRKIREIVFIKEQKVPKEEEWDGEDEKSWHYLAITNNEEHVGCARLMPTGQIGRMAVLKDFRGQGIGALILENVISHTAELGLPKVFLHAQTYAIGFYVKAGFEAYGEEFMDANIPHFAMKLQSDN